MLFRTSIFMFAALGFAGVAAAQDSPLGAPAASTPQRAVPQFQVEVLIFTHRDFDPNEEQFALEERREPAPEQTLRSLDPLEDGVEFDPDAPVSVEPTPPATDATPPVEPDTAAADAAAVPENQFTFRVLRPEELQLTSQYRVLARLPAYHPLVHGGWVTLGLPDSAALPVDLGVLGVANPVGTVRLSLTRFLHVKLDLTYVDTQAAQRGPAPAPGELAELPIAPRYRIDAERTTRSGELHYFDHPAFGVLIKVTPVKTEPNSGTGTRPAA
ncbi:MAG TPA: CsiV family protein [Gammaproteobacteria bacterium]|nr:CsiV family protein [Gammaproteobacteria bacterium]